MLAVRGVRLEVLSGWVRRGMPDGDGTRAPGQTRPGREGGPNATTRFKPSARVIDLSVGACRQGAKRVASGLTSELELFARPRFGCHCLGVTPTRPRTPLLALAIERACQRRATVSATLRDRNPCAKISFCLFGRASARGAHRSEDGSAYRLGIRNQSPSS